MGFLRRWKALSLLLPGLMALGFGGCRRPSPAADVSVFDSLITPKLLRQAYMKPIWFNWAVYDQEGNTRRYRAEYTQGGAALRNEPDPVIYDCTIRVDPRTRLFLPLANHAEPETLDWGPDGVSYSLHFKTTDDLFQIVIEIDKDHSLDLMDMKKLAVLISTAYDQRKKM